MVNILPELDEIFPVLRTIRRRLHEYPELGYQETLTSDLIASHLAQWNIPIHRGLGGTGVVGTLQRGNSTRAVGLRADMDALPITEANQFDHSAKISGKMHACGHDGHITMLLGAAWYLARHADFDGTVRLIFQPAEEGLGGARKMIEDGLFTQFPVDAVFGLHNWPTLPAGTFGITEGAIMASADTFNLIIRGKGGHAAQPHKSIDPIPIACEIGLALQTIVSRNVDPLDSAVVSLTQFHAGTAHNVIPRTVHLEGTVRTLSAATRDLIQKRITTLAGNIAKAHGADIDVHYERNYPVTINTPAEAQLAANVMQDLVTPDAVQKVKPGMTSEDFAFMLEQKPGAYAWLGSGSPQHQAMLHQPDYDFNDDIIGLGVTYWARLAEAFLA